MLKFLHLKNNFFFDKDSGSGGGEPSGDPADKTTQPAESNQNLDKKDPTSGEITFTEEQQKKIDKLVGEARKTGKDKALTDFLKSLGFETAEALQDGIKRLKEIDDSNKTEMQKLADNLNAEKAKATDAESKLAEKEKEVEKLKIRQSFQETSAELKIGFPSVKAIDDAINALDPNIVKIEEGKVTGMKEAIEALKKDRPYLFSTGTKAIGNLVIQERQAQNTTDVKDEKLVSHTIRL